MDETDAVKVSIGNKKYATHTWNYENYKHMIVTEVHIILKIFVTVYTENGRMSVYSPQGLICQFFASSRL